MSQADYLVRLHDTDGSLKEVFDKLRKMTINHKNNSISTMTLYLDGPDSRFAEFGLDNLLEVRRKVEGEDWYREYLGFHRTPQRQFTEGQAYIFTSYSRGLLDLVRRRSILYKATTAHTLKGAAAETVIKEFVYENVGADANDATRLVNGVTTGFTVDVNAALGPTWSGQRSYKNVLEVIQEIANDSHIYFDVIADDTDLDAFTFKTYYPVRGTDRRDTVIFSLDFGNMIIPSYTYSRTEEANVVAVLGPEQGTARRTLVVESLAVGDSIWNRIEATYDARQQQTLAALTSAGNEELEKLKAEEVFAFTILQTDSLKYGRDYFLGDLVTAKFEEIERTMIINEVELDLDSETGEENIKVGVELYEDP